MRHAMAGMMVIAAFAASIAGCGSPMPGDVEPVPLGDPRTMPTLDPPMAPDGEARSWSTAPWSGPWIPYEGGVQYQIDHELGREPAGVLVYLAFTADGLNPALAAGNLAQLTAVDDRRVTVWNNTEGNYFVRVVVF